ncbi:AAA family ATPase [Streptomyces spirodelae]|uniref:AAA family ATPase n=1 Tax=Streptomyces spirodelae TaxID=2812904 RepID=A0ABS3WQW7_9ACTN|nr:ATP-binding protein [Streptomyces spirodelae]MBO8185504.1 AAA family ATPase [Streptomyces spirodelae]
MGASQQAGPTAALDGPVAAPGYPGQSVRAPAVSALRLSAFRSLRARTVPLDPVTVLTGPSGSGKSTVLEAYEALARLGQGGLLEEVFGHRATTPGRPSPYVPHTAQADRQGRRGFRLGCSVTGPAGPLHFDVAVQAEPELRVVGERLSRPAGETLVATALLDPARRSVTATRQVAGVSRALRTPFPDDRLTLPLLPLRVAGNTAEDRALLAAVEQVVVALRSVFGCDPVPARMRGPVAARDGRLGGDCGNLAAVLRRTHAECATRHAALLAMVREGCAGPVTQLRSETAGSGDSAMVRGVLERGVSAPATPLEWLGEGELRFLALALVLVTGPGVLSVQTVDEVPAAQQALTVLADGLDRALDARQTAELLALAGRMARRGHVRLLATGPSGGVLAREAARTEGLALVDLGR